MYLSVFASGIHVLSTSLLAMQVVSQELTKPVIQPPIPSMEQGLFNNLKPTQSTHDQWEWGWIPDRCKDQAIQEGFSPYDIEVFNIHYSDCGSVWIMCRHHNAEQSQIDMIDLFGRMPVHMRQWVRTVIALPGVRHAYTFWDLGDVVLFGDSQHYPTLWAHEIGHALDYNAVPGYTIFSNSKEWRDNYDQDTAISDDYAKNNQVENFAQEVVIALFDKVVPGGIGGIEKNWQAIFHQYATVQGYLGNNIIPGGTCDRRWQNAGLVCMGPAAPCGQARFATPPSMPNIIVDKDVPTFAVPEGPGKVAGEA